MDVDERRRQLLAGGAELFARHAYRELSMARIARELGISKALLYHYFPSKQDFFEQTLRQGAAELSARIALDADRPPEDLLTAGLDAFLGWIEDNQLAYEKFMQSATSVSEVGDLISEMRDQTADRILGGISPSTPPSPPVRAAVRGWLWFMDGAILDWLEHRDMDRVALRDQLLGTLLGALTAAGGPSLDGQG